MRAHVYTAELSATGIASIEVPPPRAPIYRVANTWYIVGYARRRNGPLTATWTQQSKRERERAVGERGACY